MTHSASKPALAPAGQAPTATNTVAFGLLLAALGAIGFSGKAIIVKLAYRWGVDAITLLMYASGGMKSGLGVSLKALSCVVGLLVYKI